MHDLHETMDYQDLLSNHDHSNYSQLSYAWQKRGPTIGNPHNSIPSRCVYHTLLKHDFSVFGHPHTHFSVTTKITITQTSNIHA